ncbi:MAG TPA: hypothetical protein VGM03_22555 [Phycisphaerae bacterium]
MRASACCAGIFLGTRLSLADPPDLSADLSNLNIRHRTEHYALAGTAKQERLTDYGRCLEYIYKEYAKGFTELLTKPGEKPAQKTPDKSSADKSAKKAARPAAAETQPASAPADGDDITKDSKDHRFKVIIFATDAQYNAFGKKYIGPGSEHTRGMFVPSLQLLLIRDDPDSTEAYEVLFHEAFHQFIQRYVEFAPLWLNEGLATYYGTASPTANGLVFNRKRWEYFHYVQYAAGEKKLIPLDELMAEGADKFYGRARLPGLEVDRTDLSYAESYTLMAYLVADPNGREHLRKYIRGLAEAKSQAEALEVTRKTFPKKLLDDMVPGWMRAVNKQ